MTASTTEEPLKTFEAEPELPDGLDADEAGGGASGDFFQNFTQPSTLVVMTKLERGVTVTELTVSLCMSDLK